MKEFKAQVCQYVRDLIADQRNAYELNTAAKYLYNGICKKSFSRVDGCLYSYWRDGDYIIIPNTRREGKYSFSREYITMSFVDFMAYLDRCRKRMSFAARVLTEFSLIEWYYDRSSFALKNEFWEFDSFVFEEMFDDLYEIIQGKSRDAREFKRQFTSLTLRESVDSSNWIGLLIVRHAVRFMQETAPWLFIPALRSDILSLHSFRQLLEETDRVMWLHKTYPRLTCESFADMTLDYLIRRALWFVRWYTDEDAYFYAKVKEGGLGHVE